MGGLAERELYLGEEIVGTIRWEKQAGGYQITASCPLEEGWIYRVVIENKHGDYQILGVMVPSYGKFFLKKTLLLSAEKQWGTQLYQIERAEILRTGAGGLQKSELPFPPELFLPFSADVFREDPLLCESLSGCGALMKKWAGCWYLAAPLEENRPFGLVSVFCMAVPMTIDEKPYAVVGIDAKGIPFIVTKNKNGRPAEKA